MRLFGFLIFVSLFFSLLNCGCKKEADKDILVDDLSLKYYNHEEFVMGVDLSYLNAMLDHGGVFKSKGLVTDPYKIFKQAGANVVRVRLWKNPGWQNDIYGTIKYSHITDVVKTIEKAKENGLAVNLDLHYSDDWADPSKQDTPSDWKDLDLKTLKDSVYQYTFGVLKQLKEKGITPEYIQIGNENNNGILFPKGKINGSSFTNFATIIKSGIQAVRDFSINSSIKPKIILHYAQFKGAEWWLSGIMSEGVNDFDILGLSHYSKWSDVNDMSAITSNIAKLKMQSNKDVMVVEVAYPWTGQSKDSYNNLFSENDKIDGYPLTKDGQLLYMKALTQAIINGGGKGIMYWEPAWISTPNFKDRWGTGSSWENNALFDFTGNLLPGAEFMTNKYKF